MESLYRALPSVDGVLQQVQESDPDLWPHNLMVEAVRQVLERARERITDEGAAPSEEDLVAQARDLLRAWTRPGLRPAINASGVIIHTNLGRAPLSQAALEAVRRVAGGYSNLEFDLPAGRRGSRHVHARELLGRLCGAEAALAVNNNASAVLLVLSTLAAGRQVLVSRSQAVEIGGGFRVPDVMRQSGAELVEVGTTNRTYAGDYTAAVCPETTAVLRVHRSNFALVGFVHDVPLPELVDLAHSRGLYVIDDLGSGALLDTSPFGLAHEPTVQASVEAGADIVCFSGDKLLGGPQAGLIVGRAALIERIEHHPLARAVRLDKMVLAALEATLLHYVHEEAAQEIPIWRMIAQSPEAVRRRAQRWRRWLGKQGVSVQVVPGETAVGGGSLPGQTLPSWVLELEDLPSVEDAARSLRTGEPPVIPRIEGDRLLLDPRTVLPDQESTLLERLLSLLGPAKE
ncbi:MAG: L-seryl-tRNA(Sec) selenium transferase [Chloroflexia bacterium]|nr:L-seryl-tRNA(Sec) selenium transferase [Chloroflexia bacterium]